MEGRRTIRRYAAVACLLVLIAQVAALVTLTHREKSEPHRVPVVIAAPAVVAQSLSDEANALQADPFVASWTDDPAAAREAVRDGRAVAAVLVDLSETQDVVVVNARSDGDLNDAVADRLAAVGQAHGRTLEVREVAKAGADGAVGRIRLVLLLSGLLGFGVTVAISLVRGPVARASGPEAMLRVGVLGAASLVGGVLLQVLPATRLPGNDVEVIALTAAYILALGLITLAAEALAGLPGLAAVAATYLVLATPLLSGTSFYLLPLPWPVITPWTPTGAAGQALASVAYFDPRRAVSAALILGAAVAGSLLVLTISRSLRRQAPEGSDDQAQPAIPVRHWRLWLLVAVLPLVAVTAVAVRHVPSEAVRAGPLPSVASSTSCVRSGPPPTGVEGVNRLLTDLAGEPALQGADVGASVRLQDDRVVFVFGDSLRGESFDGPRFVRNSMMIWAVDCASVVLPPGNGALIPDRLDGVGYWPMSLAVAHRPGYDLVLVTTQRVRTTGGSSFSFANLGPALAVFVVREGGTPQLVDRVDVGRDDADKARPEWGAASAVAGGWLYLYGTAQPEETDAFGFELHVARVRPDDVVDPSRWRYWGGERWQPDAGRSAALIPAAGGVSETLSVFHRGERWFALSKRDGDLGDELVFWTAAGPTGPFTLRDPVASAPSDPSTGAVRYMPLAHPEMFTEKGWMVASYSRNNTDFDKVLADPTLYRPRFLRVPLPR